MLQAITQAITQESSHAITRHGAAPRNGAPKQHPDCKATGVSMISKCARGPRVRIVPDHRTDRQAAEVRSPKLSHHEAELLSQLTRLREAARSDRFAVLDATRVRILALDRLDDEALADRAGRRLDALR